MSDEPSNVTALAPRLKVAAESEQLKRIDEANREGQEDNRKWTIEDLLVDALSRLRKGEITGDSAALIIHTKGTGDINWGMCNLNRLEFCGLLSRAIVI